MPTSRSAAGAPTPGRPKRAARRTASPRTVPLASAPVVLPPEPRPEFVYLSPGKRVVRGRAARRDAPRASHGQWRPAPDRPDPIALLEEQAETRVPELVPIRYGRMLVSPFTFFRGAALIMAADLAPTPNSGITVQLCGDAHVSNFGVFGSPERQLIFDINDFDETLPGPVGVGPQASDGQPRDRRSRPRLRRRRSPRRRFGGGPRVPRHHAPVGRHAGARRLVCADERRRRDGLDAHRGARAAPGQARGQGGGARPRQGADARQHAGLRQTDRHRRRRAADRRRAAAGRAHRRPDPARHRLG